MTDDLTSPTLKSGNVLALLNTLYTSGFAMASSSTPLLKGKTMHTLYAISFVVYVTNAICSWLHVSFVVKGYVTSYPLSTWIVVTLVVTAVTGTMLTWLLVVLCIENAFAHRLDITPYRSGCALLFEAFIEWTQAFNNFRVSFLIMSLHDAPITVFNYFFIAACRCPNPKMLSWPLILSSASCTVSLIWRVAVLYFAYKRMICSRKRRAVQGVAVNTPVKKHFQMAINTNLSANGARLGEFDETWPIRWARIKTLGPHLDVSIENEKNEVNEKIQNGNGNIAIINIENNSISKKRKTLNLPAIIYNIIGYISWVILSILVYILMAFICFIPTIYHYTCRHNSFYHRHKLCRSFIRYFSSIFHYAIFYMSLFFSLFLIGLNIVFLLSVHGLGSNTIPPEIDRICITVSPASQMIYANILPTSAFERSIHLKTELNSKFAAGDKNAITECKPLWKDGGLGFGMSRKEAGTWEMRTPINNSMLAVSTYVSFNNSNIQVPALKLEYTHTVFTRNGARYTCNSHNNWKIVPSVAPVSWPYFYACEQNWIFIQNSDLIECHRQISHPLRHNSRFSRFHWNF